MVPVNALKAGEAGPGEETEASLAGDVRVQANGCWLIGPADLAKSGWESILNPSCRLEYVNHIRAGLMMPNAGRASSPVSREPRNAVISSNLRLDRAMLHRITALLRDVGWRINHKRVERLSLQK